ncbi:hypothetical protein [Anaerosacchariphilus polymeriproducens]|uniref:DUF3221 domain-containing protein n=1 Tax=Anaerosacchariphilus polymeriproducens TaxID=1812858 RepID=A0A371AWV9_9FIRM|nr:hypothetical protein [Anaerosacchariphilus polymeriproducens]RDU24031.1 hypothetical protein DWV06_06990 [Anaerosacchariphilus polymeriproducens]
MRKKTIIISVLIIIIGIIISIKIFKNDTEGFKRGKSSDVYRLNSKGTVIAIDKKKKTLVVSIINDELFKDGQTTLNCENVYGFENLDLKVGDKIIFYYFSHNNYNNEPFKIEAIETNNQS